MLNLSAIRNFAFEGIDPYILSVYANNVASIIISGGFSDNVNMRRSLFDFYAMKDDNGVSIRQLFVEYGKNVFYNDVKAAGSDIGDLMSQDTYWDIFGRLQGLCVTYTQDESGLITKSLSIGSSILFKMLVFNNIFAGFTMNDKKVVNALNRLVVPTKKSIKANKLRNFYSDLLFGVSNKEHVYCGPKIDILETDNSGLNITFTNSTAINVNEVLYIPLAFLYIIDDVFNAILDGGTLASGNLSNLAKVEKDIMEPVLNDINECFKASNRNKFIMLNVYTLKDKNKLISELIAGTKLNDWGRRPLYSYKRNITLSEATIRKVYGQEDKENGVKVIKDSVYSKNKIKAAKGKLGLLLGDFDLHFYNLRASLDSTNMLVIDPINFAYLGECTTKESAENAAGIRETANISSIAMLSVYLEFIDYIFDNRFKNLNKLWELTSVPENLLKALYSEEHYNFMIIAAKFYEPIDLYRIAKDPELAFIFNNSKNKLGTFAKRCVKRTKELGITKNEYEQVDLPVVDKTMSESVVQMVRTRRKDIIKSVLSNNVCMVSIKIKKYNKVQTLYVTSNKDIIKSVYGDNYIGKYGSLRYRLKYVYDRLGALGNVADIKKLLEIAALDEISGQPIDLGTKSVLCDELVYSNDVDVFKNNVYAFIMNVSTKTGIKSFEDAAESTKELVDRPLVAVNLGVSKRSAANSKNGKAKFNVWVYEYAVEDLQIIK